MFENLGRPIDGSEDASRCILSGNASSNDNLRAALTAPVQHPIGHTEADQLTKQRIGQDRCRAVLLGSLNGTCLLTGLSDTGLLWASHIVTSADCESDQDRLNVHNGLLLSALWDPGFDNGLLSLDDNGMTLPSPRLSTEACAAFCVEKAARLMLTQDQGARMERHRRYKWFAE